MIHASRSAPEEPASDPVEALIAERKFREATSLLLLHYGRAIGRLCMALTGSQAEAEELLQETLLAAHDQMAQYRGDGSVRAWLYGIARRKCARRLARSAGRERRLQLVYFEGAEGLDAPEGPDSLVQKKQRAERVRNALGRLTPTEREAVLLRYEADLSFREVAQCLQIDEEAARKRASRGLLRLREIMKGEAHE
jgi:RNA polymerase sigma-70 factor (ECF subfamily)